MLCWIFGEMEIMNKHRLYTQCAVSTADTVNSLNWDEIILIAENICLETKLWFSFSYKLNLQTFTAYCDSYSVFKTPELPQKHCCSYMWLKLIVFPSLAGQNRSWDDADALGVGLCLSLTVRRANERQPDCSHTSFSPFLWKKVDTEQNPN